jgi:CCR4-NOT transcriptional regulation complex NOT5 subunit
MTKVSIGVAKFKSIYEEIEQSTNAAHKGKLGDSLRQEIRKLQRMRDQIQIWEARDDKKNKVPLPELLLNSLRKHRKLIETVCNASMGA